MMKMKESFEFENISLDELMKIDYLKEEMQKIGGKKVFKILKALEKIEDDEKIAKRLNMKVSDVRIILNKLYEEKIVNYERIKDKDTGWYYYIWKFSPSNIIHWFRRKMSSKINYLQSLISLGDYYYCKKCSLDNPIKFEEAFDYRFVCPIHKKGLQHINDELIEEKRQLLNKYESYIIKKINEKKNKEKKKRKKAKTK